MNKKGTKKISRPVPGFISQTVKFLGSIKKGYAAAVPYDGHA
jgi:hypothetical protein